MNINVYETYTRHEYAVSALDCHNQFREIIMNASLEGMTHSRSEYISILHGSLEDYARAKKIDPNWTQAKKDNAYIIAPKEPSFDWWFAIYLSMVDHQTIPLILDYYKKNWPHEDIVFANFLEYVILKIQEKNLFHDFKKNTKEIINWIREDRRTNPTENIQNTGETQNSTLFQSPYHEMLLSELLNFCEEDSKDSLKEVLLGRDITNPVILKLNFKKISFRNALKLLILKGDAIMSQESCARWLFENFRIRRLDRLDEFSINGTKDAFRKRPEQTGKSQLKFEDWYK